MYTYKKRMFLLSACFIVAAMAFAAFGIIMVMQTSAADRDKTYTEFLETFTAHRGTAAMDGETLVYAPEREGTYLEVDTTDYVLGSQWCVQYLQVRNTAVIHVKTSGESQDLRIFFRTKTKPYSEENSITVTVLGDGEFHTVYANFSSLPAATGHLTGIRIQPQNAEDTLYIDRMAFEIEDPLYAFAGSVDTCTADGRTVTIKGTLSSGYAGKTVDLYRTDISNMAESLRYLTPIASVTADGGKFSFQLPYHDGEITLLSAMFIAAVEDVKVSRMFNIQNWRDMTENPYEFELPALTKSVLDYGAKGDGFTDDTPSINAAIADVSSKGGGTVVVPGDDSFYKRRYIVSSVTMCDNVELRLESGSMLLQTFRDSDYAYQIYKDHDDGEVRWGHNGLVNNMPLVYFGGVENAKLTGGGTIRLFDPGTQLTTDSYGSAYSPYCPNMVHLIPIGIYNSKNIEISDLALLRTTCYHLVVFDCDTVFIGNLKMTENACRSGDGISLGVGTKNVVIDRCNLYTNDDSIVIVSMSTAEPRGKTWWHSKPNGDNRVENITLRHSAITPGNAVVFITWGSDSEDWTYQAINNIYIYDNQLGNNTTTSSALNVHGGYGYPYGTGGQFSPVNGVHVFDNLYRGSFNIGMLQSNNWTSDCEEWGVVSPAAFYDAGFTKKLGFWSYSGEYQTDVLVEGSSAKIIGDDSSVYQGLKLLAGTHTFTANVNGIGKLFAKDSLTGELLGEAIFDKSAAGTETLVVTLQRPATVLLGCAGGGTGTTYFGGAALSSVVNPADGYFSQTFADDTDYFDESAFVRTEDNKLKLGDSVHVGNLNFQDVVYRNFDLKLDFTVGKTAAEAGAGALKLEFSRAKVGSYNRTHYRVEADAVGQMLRLIKCYYNTQTKSIEEITLGEVQFQRHDGAWVQLGVSMNEGTILVYLDGQQALSYTDGQALSTGTIRAQFYYMDSIIDNIIIAQEGSLAFGKSEHYTDLPEQEEEPDGNGNGNDNVEDNNGCSCSSMTLGSISGVAALIVIGGAALLLRRKKHSSR